MDKRAIYINLRAVFPELQVNEPMSGHTSLRVGGPAAYFLIPRGADDIREAIRICNAHGCPFYIMGGGTNLIVRDGGYDGLIIKISELMGHIELLPNNRVAAGAGASLMQLADFAAERALAGLEFASGIPGHVGGAVCMNAGAYGGEIKDALVSADVMDADGNISTLTNAELAFGYRDSAVQRKNLVVLNVLFEFHHDDTASIRRRMDELNDKRRASQPLDQPSAGSTFKRPHGHYAAKLIADAGLTGFTIGGARVSDKHCGFIVNGGNATAADVIALIEHIQTTVKQRFGVHLEPEPRIIGVCPSR